MNPLHRFESRPKEQSDGNAARRTFTREEILTRVARFKNLKGYDGGLPDSHMPGCERTLYNVIGFQPPAGAGGGVTSPTTVLNVLAWI